MYTRFLVAAGCVLASCAPSSAQSDLQTLADELAMSAAIPAAAVVEARCGQVETASAGRARMDSPGLVGSESRFNLGSNSKSFLAIAAARLVEAGRMDWTLTLAQSGAFPNLPANSRYAEVTIVDLLSHTAGVATYHTGDILSAVEVSGPPETHARQFAEQALLASPAGARGRYAYSNAGPVIAALMLQSVSGQDWLSLIEDIVLEAWALDAGLGVPNPQHSDQPYGHYAGEDGLTIWDDEAPEIDPFLQPSGYLSITPESYGQYLAFQVCGLAGEDTPQLTAQSIQMVHSPLYDTPSALGWGRTEVGETSWSVHIGSTGAHYAFAAVNADIAYAVLVNSGTPEAGAAAQAALVQLISDE